MTQPGPQGYPDWRRVATQANVLYLDEDITATNTTVNRGPFFVGTQRYMGIYLEAISGQWTFKFTFYSDQARTHTLDAYEFDLANLGETLHVSVPVVGPWVYIQATAYGVGVQCATTLWGASDRLTSNRFSFSNVLISETAIAIAAGASQTFNADPVWPGEAHLCFQQAAGTSRLLLFQLFAGGGTLDLWRRDLTAAQPVGELVKLPAGSVRATVTNTSAAATTFSLYLVGGYSLV